MPPPRPLAAALLAAFAVPGGQAPRLAAADPIPPATVTLTRPDARLGDVLKAVADQTGIPVDAPGLDPKTPCPVAFDKTPFWAAVGRVAVETGAVVSLSKQGRQVTLVKRPGPVPLASVDGPFRVAVRQVQCRTDFDAGRTFTEVTLDIHWEPRFPVFRLDGQPTITAAEDDRGSKVTAATSRARTPPTGSLYTTTVRVEGVPRSATKLTRLAGSFTVTAADRMLPFTFADLTAKSPTAGALPAGVDGRGVAASLRRFEKVENRWAVELHLQYPPAGPQFESFESWVADNRLQLIGPRGEVFEPADYNVPEQGRRVVAEYFFTEDPAKGPRLGDRKGWRLVYTTPAPLTEFPVHFDLRDIPLP